MVRAFGLMLLLTTLTACAGVPARDDAAASAQVKTTMQAFAAMNVDGFKAGLAPDVLGYELDLENKPLRLASRDEAGRSPEGVFGDLKKAGATVTLDIDKLDCHAGANLAYCTVEFEFKAAMGDGTTMTQSSRNSVVLAKPGNEWVWTHWHSSLA